MTDWPAKLAMLGVGLAAFLFVIGLIVLLASYGPRDRKERFQLLVFMGPGAILMTIGMIYPALRTFQYSFMDAGSTKWVGFENFTWMFTQPDILIVLRNTAIWVLIVPLAVVLLGLLYAILVDNKPGEAFAKSLIFLPMAISFVGASIIWKFVYAYKVPSAHQIGLLNQIVIWLGLTPPDGGWLLNSPSNNFFIMLVMVWSQVGFTLVLLSAAIKAVPQDIIEAARLDGVNAVQMFFRITVPVIRPTLITTYMTVLLMTLKSFDIVRTMTGGNFNTSVLATEMYFRSFPGQQAGQGAALAVFLFVLVLPAVFFQVRQLRHQKEIR